MTNEFKLTSPIVTVTDERSSHTLPLSPSQARRSPYYGPKSPITLPLYKSYQGPSTVTITELDTETKSSSSKEKSNVQRYPDNHYKSTLVKEPPEPFTKSKHDNNMPLAVSSPVRYTSKTIVSVPTNISKSWQELYGRDQQSAANRKSPLDVWYNGDTTRSPGSKSDTWHIGQVPSSSYITQACSPSKLQHWEKRASDTLDNKWTSNNTMHNNDSSPRKSLTYEKVSPVQGAWLNHARKSPNRYSEKSQLTSKPYNPNLLKKSILTLYMVRKCCDKTTICT
jgi:hypothetical protein